MKDLICEGNGDVSSIRLFMWLGFLVAVGVTVYAMLTNHVSEDIPLIGTWLMPAGFKAAQKFGEEKPSLTQSFDEGNIR
jgi:hypothetical protein